MMYLSMCTVLSAGLVTSLPIESQQNQRIVISNHVSWTVETPMIHLLENSVLVAMANSAWYSHPLIEGIVSVMNNFLITSKKKSNTTIVGSMHLDPAGFEVFVLCSRPLFYS